MTQAITGNVDGYSVSYEIHPDNGTSQCYVMKAGASASLEWLMDYGTLVTSLEVEVPVDPTTIAKIKVWAEIEGYFD